jgi:hypothetical protein
MITGDILMPPKDNIAITTNPTCILATHPKSGFNIVGTLKISLEKITALTSFEDLLGCKYFIHENIQ